MYGVLCTRRVFRARLRPRPRILAESTYKNRARAPLDRRHQPLFHFLLLLRRVSRGCLKPWLAPSYQQSKPWPWWRKMSRTSKSLRRCVARPVIRDWLDACKVLTGEVRVLTALGWQHLAAPPALGNSQPSTLHSAVDATGRTGKCLLTTLGNRRAQGRRRRGG